MAAVEETTNSSLPRLKWTDGGVEEVEGNTARLSANWAMRFSGGERTR